MLEVLAQFRVIFNSVRRHYRVVQQKTGMGGAQIWALSVISENPGINVGELARLLLIHQSTASNLIRDLTRFGAISKERLEADQRTVQLQVTAKGRAILKRAPRPWTGVLQQALSNLSERELDALQLHLVRVVDFAEPIDKRGRSKLLSEM